MKNKSNQKVLHIITRLVSGGADENTLFTVDGLDKKGYEVDLLIGRQSEEKLAECLSAHRVIVMPQLVRDLHPLYDVVAFIRICSLIIRNRYDIVHTHTAKAGMLGRFAAKMCRIPVIVHTLHGSTFHENLSPMMNRLYRFLERKAIKITDKTITVGEDLKKRYLEAGVGHENDYVTIRSGFDMSRFRLSEEEILRRRHAVRKEHGLVDSDIVIGSASRLEPRKGHTYFLDAALQISQVNRRVKFLIAGNGYYGNDLKNYTKKIGLEQNVQFLGHRTDIEDVLCAMDIFVLSSLWEGLPRVLVQCSAIGKPIITFDIEGARELVVDGENGYVVPLKNVTQLSEKVSFLVNHPEKAREMGKKGRLKVTDDWDKQVMVEKIEKLYKDLSRS